RANYRRFKMKTVTGQDDFACMAETVRRRYSRLLKEAQEPPTEDGGLGVEEPRQDDATRITQHASRTTHHAPRTTLPDLILIDGGKGQLNAASSELAQLGLSHIPI